MKTLILALGLFFGTIASAQMQSPPQDQPQAQPPPDCQFQVNPHSYACAHWTFEGNQMFPLFQFDLNTTMQGWWEPLTYSVPGTDNEDNEFVMMKNPARPTVPEGVGDKVTGRRLGPMLIQGNNVFFSNWHGIQIWSVPNTSAFPDAVTWSFQYQDQFGLQSFNCRDFNRNNKHHMLCAWDTWMVPQSSWQHRGYIGFLAPRDLPHQ